MDRRPKLDETFCNIINITDPVDGDTHVYFQPPASVEMKYPAIRYKLSGYNTVFANDGKYRLVPTYEVTLMDRNPDSIYVKEILNLPGCRFDRAYSADNLNHFVYTLHHI